VTRFRERILDERAMWFGGFTYTEGGLRNDLDIERRENRADLIQLADVI
jgi:hypothetical protein